MSISHKLHFPTSIHYKMETRISLNWKISLWSFRAKKTFSGKKPNSGKKNKFCSNLIYQTCHALSDFQVPSTRPAVHQKWSLHERLIFQFRHWMLFYIFPPKTWQEIAETHSGKKKISGEKHWIGQKNQTECIQAENSAWGRPRYTYNLVKVPRHGYQRNVRENPLQNSRKNNTTKYLYPTLTFFTKW